MGVLSFWKVYSTMIVSFHALEVTASRDDLAKLDWTPDDDTFDMPAHLRQPALLRAAAHQNADEDSIDVGDSPRAEVPSRNAWPMETTVDIKNTQAESLTEEGIYAKHDHVNTEQVKENRSFSSGLDHVTIRDLQTDTTYLPTGSSGGGGDPGTTYAPTGDNAPTGGATETPTVTSLTETPTVASTTASPTYAPTYAPTTESPTSEPDTGGGGGSASGGAAPSSPDQSTETPTNSPILEWTLTTEVTLIDVEGEGEGDTSAFLEAVEDGMAQAAEKSCPVAACTVEATVTAIDGVTITGRRLQGASGTITLTVDITQTVTGSDFDEDSDLAPGLVAALTISDVSEALDQTLDGNFRVGSVVTDPNDGSEPSEETAVSAHCFRWVFPYRPPVLPEYLTDPSL